MTTQYTIKIEHILIALLSIVCTISTLTMFFMIQYAVALHDNLRAAQDGMEACKMGMTRADAKLEQIEGLLGLAAKRKENNLGIGGGP
jgi:hypothetical protein